MCFIGGLAPMRTAKQKAASSSSSSGYIQGVYLAVCQHSIYLLN